MSESGLRFAMLTTFYPPHHFGGDAAYVKQLSHALAARGHSVDVFADIDAYRLLAPGSEPTPPPDPDGLRVHRLESRFGKLSSLATQQTGRPVFQGRRIARLLDQIRPDVLHFHNVSLIGGPGLLAYGNGVKLYTAHEHWLVCPTHILWRHGREPCPERQCLRCVLKAGRPPQLWRSTGLLERKAAHVDAFLSPSRFSARKHREFGFPVEMREHPLFLPDGPRPEPGQTQASPGEARPPYFLFAGRLEEIKGLQDVIPLFREDLGAELWIAGRGEYESSLRSLAEGNPRIRFLGMISPEELRGLTANAVALVAPSRCYEVFPVVLLEAFREGTAVIARRLGPYPEIVEQSGGGLLFSNTDELRAGLLELAGNREERARLGAAGRATFDARWSEGVVLRSYFSMISELAAAKGDASLAERAARHAGGSERGASP